MNVHHHLKGLSVFSVADGERLGAVSRVYLDPTARAVVGIGFDTGSGFLVPAREPIVDVANIQAVGHDALLLANKDAVDGSETDRQYASLIETDDLINRPVMSTTGHHEGRIVTLEIDEHSFALTGLEVKDGRFRGHRMMSIEDVRVFGRDYVIAADPRNRAGTTEEPPAAIEDTQPAATSPAG